MLKKRGFVLTMDAGIAFFISLLVIISTNFFIAKTEEQFWTKYHVVKSAQDTIAMLNYNGTFQVATSDDIDKILKTLDPNTEMYIEVSCTDGTAIKIGALTKQYRFIFSDKYVFIKMSDSTIEKLCVAEYATWVK